LHDEGSCKKCECHGNEYKCEEKCPQEMKKTCQEWSQWFNDNKSQNLKTDKEKKSAEELKQLGFCTEVIFITILKKLYSLLIDIILAFSIGSILV
jgi:hypothetical protein